MSDGAEDTVPTWNPRDLTEPLTWKEPRRVRVAGLFECTKRYAAAAMTVMAACPEHTFVVPVENPRRASDWFDWWGAARGDSDGGLLLMIFYVVVAFETGLPLLSSFGADPTGRPWPLPNVLIEG